MAVYYCILWHLVGTKILVRRKKKESNARSRTGEDVISSRKGPRKAEVSTPRLAPVIPSGLILIHRTFDLLDAGSGMFDITPLCKCQGESYLEASFAGPIDEIY